MKKLISELQRRNVIKAIITYVTISWVLLQVLSIVFPLFNVPDIVFRGSFITLLVGFPIWVVFAYMFEWTPKGFKKTASVNPEVSVTKNTGKLLNKIIIASLSTAVILLVADRIFHFTNVYNIPNTKKAVAVLPFENMSEQADAYFAEGVSEDILTQISKINNLRVLSRFTMKDYDPSGKTVKQIGEELGVGYLLTGSIRRAGQALRISCHLVQVDPEKETWAENYDKEMEDVFAIQSEVATDVARMLKATLTTQEKESIDKKPTHSLEAYNYYLQAKSFIANQNSKDTELGINLLLKALAIDPEFSKASAALMRAYSRSVFNFGTRSVSFFDSTRVLLEDALKLDPTSQELLVEQAYYYAVEGDFEKAIDISKRNIENNPNDANSINVLGLLYRNAGRIDEAIPLFRQGLSLEPTKIEVYYYNLGSCYETLGLYAEALQYYKPVIELEKSSLITVERVAETYLSMGDYQAVEKTIDMFFGQEDGENAMIYDLAIHYALNAKLNSSIIKGYIQKIKQLEDFSYLDHSNAVLTEAYFLKNEGKKDSVSLILDKLYNVYLDGRGENHDDGEILIPFVKIELLRGNHEKALDWVKKIVKTGSLWAYQMMQNDLILAPLRENPKYKTLTNELQQRIAVMRARIVEQNSQGIAEL